MDKKPTSEIRSLLIEELETILARDLSKDDAGKPLRELGVDSLSLVELFVSIEKLFGVKLMESGMTKDDFQSIDALASAISNAE